MQVENYIIKNSETIENTDRNRKRHIQIEMYMSLKYGRGDYLYISIYLLQLLSLFYQNLFLKYDLEIFYLVFMFEYD